MTERKNRMEVKFIPTDKVRLQPKNVIANDFHYVGELPNPQMRVSTATVIKPHFSVPKNEMSYLIQFEGIVEDGSQWFLESELH